MFPKKYFTKEAVQENDTYQRFIKTRLVEYLKDEVKLKRDIRHVLRLAALNGHYKYLKHLLDTPKYSSLISIEDIKHDNNCLLVNAGLGGHVDVLDLLVKRYNLSIDDLRVQSNHILRYAHYYNLTELLEYLQNNYSFTQHEFDEAIKYQSRLYVSKT